jgi:hypothetical protein
VFNVSVVPPFGSSDHCQVNFCIVLENKLAEKLNTDSLEDCQPSIVQYNWSEADFDGIRDYLSSYNWSDLFCVNLTVDAMWQAFSTVVRTAINMYVPTRGAPTRSGRKRYPKKARKALARKNVSGANTAMILPTLHCCRTIKLLN